MKRLAAFVCLIICAFVYDHTGGEGVAEAQEPTLRDQLQTCQDELRTAKAALERIENPDSLIQVERIQNLEQMIQDAYATPETPPPPSAD